MFTHRATLLLSHVTHARCLAIVGSVMLRYARVSLSHCIFYVSAPRTSYFYDAINRGHCPLTTWIPLGIPLEPLCTPAWICDNKYAGRSYIHFELIW